MSSFERILEEASTEAKNEFHIIPDFQKIVGSWNHEDKDNSFASNRRKDNASKSKRNCSMNCDNVESAFRHGQKEDDIISQLTEYLYDFFDAPNEIGYAELEKFREEACFLFADLDQVEYSIEQKQKHEDFCFLFEDIIQGFLIRENITNDELHAQLKIALRSSSCIEEEANEVLDLINHITNFQDWAEYMKLVAKEKIICKRK